MLVKHEYSFLLIEDFCEEILLEKQGLKRLVNNYKFQLYWDWVKYYDNLSDSDIYDICNNGNDAKYYYNILVYKKYFVDFILSIKKLIDDKKNFIDKLLTNIQCDSIYSNSNDLKSLILISDIYSLDSKYFSFLDLDKNKDFLDLRDRIADIYCNFKMDYFAFKYAKNVDQVMTGIKLGDEQKFNQNEYVKSDKKIIYLDTNIFSQILENDDIKKKIILSKDKYQYCYSAYLLEDKVKQNLLFTAKVFDLITEITDNLLISATGSYPKLKMNFFLEDPSSVLKRVKLWLYQTQSAEDNQFNSMIIEKLYYKKNEKIKNFNVQQMVEYLENPNSNLKNLARSLNLSNAFDKRSSKIERISALLNILNILEFKVDTKKQKIISSFQDSEHLKVAHIADYFITDDRKLSERAETIYKISKCNVEVILFRDFLEKL